MDDFDRDVLRFVLRWAPYGGVPDDEVLPRFGLTPAEFCGRVTNLISRDGNQPLLGIADHALIAGVGALVRSQRPLLSGDRKQGGRR